MKQWTNILLELVQRITALRLKSLEDLTGMIKMEMLEELLMCRDLSEKPGFSNPHTEALNNNIDYVINRR